MQPSNLKLKTKAKGLARAKMLIKTHLYWLKGCPVFEDNKLMWQCPLSSNNLVIITPKMVSKAQRTVNDLFKDFPIALPKIVGDSQVWFDRCHEYLNYYKQLIKNSNNSDSGSLFTQNITFKEKFNRYLPNNNPDLVNALSWMYFIDRKPLKSALAFINLYEIKLNEDTLSKQDYLHLIHLYAQDGKRAQGLIGLIFKTATINVSMEISDRHFDNHTDCKIPKPEKHVTLERTIIRKVQNNQIILKFLQWIVLAKPPQRKRVLTLLNSFDLSAAIIKWYNWWKKADVLCLKIENIFNYPDKRKAKQLLTQQKKLKNLQTNKPDNLNLATVVSAIKEFSQQQELTQALQKLFIALPKRDSTTKYNYPTRIKFLIYFHMIANYGALKATHLPNYILLLAKYIKSHPQTYNEAPWQQLEEYYWGTLESTLFDELKLPDFERFFNILNKVQQHYSINSDKTERVITLTTSRFSDERVVSLCLHLLENKKLGYVPKIVIKMMEYYDLSNTDILKLLAIWNKFNEEFTDDDTLKVMFNAFREIDAVDIFKQLLFTGYANALRQDCYQVRIIKKLASIKDVPKFDNTIEQSDDWINDYPKNFHENLKQINKITEKCEKKVNKIFSAHWWTKPMIKTQIALLEKQLEKCNEKQSQRLQPRLTNLRANLKNHKDITDTEKEKIQNKLDTLITKENYNGWKQRLFAVFKDHWVTFFQLQNDQLSQWFFSSDIIHKLMPIIDFNNHDKKLAIKVIQQRCLSDNPHDWKFLEEEKNQQFIKHMNKSGFDMDKWINGCDAQVYQAKNSAPITLSIAQDPLEILNMGAYFKTCLSPTSFNYFSVFANIADINKQVIYAKNAKGKVVGRVLVGITQTGGLMIYHLYFHNAQQGFNKFAPQNIKDWAAQIGLTLTENGEVSTLVSTNWYDDGAITIDNGIDCFKKDSDFRKSLATLKADEFIQKLKQQLLPAKITPMTFSLLISLPELPQNNALYPILIDLAQQLAFVHDEDKVKLYKLSHEMGYSHYSHYFRETSIKYQNKKLKKDKWLDVDLGILMAKNYPIDALKIIKKYGRITSKKWQNNLDYNTHKIAVIALNNLERKQQAIEIEKFYEN